MQQPKFVKHLIFLTIKPVQPLWQVPYLPQGHYAPVSKRMFENLKECKGEGGEQVTLSFEDLNCQFNLSSFDIF